LKRRQARTSKRYAKRRKVKGVKTQKYAVGGPPPLGEKSR